MNTLAVRFLFLLAGAVPLAPAQPIETVPFKLVDNRMFIDVQIDGHAPVPMMFDTGGINLIHRDYAKRFGLTVKEGPKVSGTGGAMVNSGYTRIREVRIGRVALRDQEASVLDVGDADVFGTFRFAGLVGRELMDAYVIRADYQRRELAFYPKSFEYSGPGEVLRTDPNSNIPVVDGRIDGLPARLGLDTGARTAIVVYGGFIARNNMRERYKPKFSGITGWGIGGPIRTDLARIGSVDIGSARIERPVARLTVMKTGLTASDRISALIGPDILSRFIVWLDLSRERVILERSSAFGSDAPYDRSGMWIGQSDPSSFVVLDVMSDSPAARAGLQPGDRIESVDGVRASKLLLPTVRDRFRTEPDGSAITFGVQRAGKVESKRLVLTDFLS